MIHISDIAQSHFANLLEKKAKGTQIRIFVNNPGTIHAECGVAYCLPDSVEKDDIEFKFEKLTAYVDKLSILYLKDAKIDLINNALGSQLTIKAPYIKVKDFLKKNSSKENSSLMQKVESFLHQNINPRIANHGGYLSLIKITDDGYVIVQFGGNCIGCTMVDITLKEGIEKQLLHEFPEIKGVCDFNEFQNGTNSFIE